MTTTDLLAAFSAALSLIALLVSILVAKAQLSLSRREQLFPLLSEILSTFHWKEFRETREYVKNDFARDFPPNKDGKLLFSEEARDRVQPVTSFFFRVGLLVYERVISVELVSAYMGRSILDCWEVLMPYIRSERQRRGDPLYYSFFEHLAAEIRHLGHAQLTKKLKLRRWE
jgi:hypothetical protein